VVIPKTRLAGKLGIPAGRARKPAQTSAEVEEILARPQVGQQQPLVKENNHIPSMKH
jgi:hypothetical protein